MTDDKKAPQSQVDPVRTAQIEIIDEALKKSVKRWEINPNSRYILMIDGRKIRPDIVAEIARGLARAKVTNVLIHVSDDIEATLLFKEQTK